MWKKFHRSMFTRSSSKNDSLIFQFVSVHFQRLDHRTPFVTRPIEIDFREEFGSVVVTLGLTKFVSSTWNVREIIRIRLEFWLKHQQKLLNQKKHDRIKVNYEWFWEIVIRWCFVSKPEGKSRTVIDENESSISFFCFYSIDKRRGRRWWVDI